MKMEMEKVIFRNFSQIRHFTISIPSDLGKAVVNAGYDWSDICNFLKSPEGYERIFQQQTGVPPFFNWGEPSRRIQQKFRIEMNVPNNKRSEVKGQILQILKDCLTSATPTRMQQMRSSTFQLYKRNEAEILEPHYVRRVMDAVKCLETFRNLCYLRNASEPLYMSWDEVTDQVNTGQGFHSYGDGTYIVKKDVLKILLVSLCFRV